MAQEESTTPETIQSQEIEAVYAISRVVASAIDIEDALAEIIWLTRPALLIDSIVLYVQREDSILEPTYGRAIDRGRLLEEDLAWSDSIANETYSSDQMIIRMEDLTEIINDSTGIRHYLGLPLKFADHIKGALVFIRFGGLTYTQDQIRLAELVALQVVQLVEHGQLAERITDLEAKLHMDSIQEDFLAMISNELQTPLGFIKGYTTTLLREDNTWDEDIRHEFLSIIDEESDQLREQIDNLMDVSRLQAGTLRMKFQPFILNEMLGEISARARSRDENREISLNLTTIRPRINADPTRLAQVLDHILENAFKYAPGSPITISVDKTDNKVRIRIMDRGQGIEPEHLEHIFQRFYRVPRQTSTSVRGMGLGLYICRKIVEAHNGEISAESIVGQGTTFNILLPCD